MSKKIWFSEEAITRAVEHLGPLTYPGDICWDSTDTVVVYEGDLYLCPIPAWNPPAMGINLGQYCPRLAALIYLCCQGGGVDRYNVKCALEQYGRKVPPEWEGLVTGEP